MPTPKRPLRECRDYERQWNDFCVDKNLKDDWLVRLNSLKCLQLISICEGHLVQKARSSRTFPHIKLRAQELLLSGIAGRWDHLRPVISNELHNRFQDGDTYLELELMFRFRWSRGRFPYRENFTVRIHSQRARTSREMDTLTDTWFEQTIHRIEELDNLLFAFCQRAGP